MSQVPTVLRLHLQFSSDYDDVERDDLTRRLLAEIRDSDVESSDIPVSTGQPLSGTKAAEKIILGQIVLAVLPALIPPTMELLRSWLGRQRDDRLKIVVDPVEIEVVGDMSDEEWQQTMRRVREVIEILESTDEL